MELEKLTPRVLRNAVAAMAVLVAILALTFEPDPVEITFAYSTDAKKLLDPLIDRFNDSQDDVFVTKAARPSGDVLQDILGGEEIDLWMPAASTWGRLLNFETGTEMAPEGSPSFFWSPEVIGTFNAVSDDYSIESWSDIADLATGRRSLADGEVFRLGHTKPTSSTSGLYALVSEFSAIAADGPLVDAGSMQKVRAIEEAVLHYGDVADEFCDRLFDYSSAYVSAFYMQETTFLQCRDRYPDLGLEEVVPDQTFVADYPAFLLDAPWLKEEEAGAARKFLDWLRAELDDADPVLAQRFRLGDPWDEDGTTQDLAPNGAHDSESWQALEVPPGETLSAVLNAWPEVRKPSNVLILLEKGDMHVDSAIDTAKELLRRFIQELPDGVTVGLDSFDVDVVEEAPLGELDELQQATLLDALGGIGARGEDSFLPDALMASIDKVDDPNRISLIVLVSLGVTRDVGERTLGEVLTKLGDLSRRTSPIQVFTISFGDPDGDRVLDAIATRSLGGCADSKLEGDDSDRCERIAANDLLHDLAGIV